MSSITGHLSRTERQDLLHLFALFDTEKQGSISVKELKSVLVQVSQEQQRPALQRVLALPVFQQADNNNQRITQDEFVQLLTNTEDSSEDQVRRVFNLFDKDRKGYISVHDLQRIATELGETDMQQEELEEMIQRASAMSARVGAEGRVTMEEFEAVLNHSLMSSFWETENDHGGVGGRSM